MQTLEEQFNARLNAFLSSTGMSPTTLGMMAVGDPNLLRQIERGRSPSLRTADRILAFMAAWEADPGGARPRPSRPAGPRPATRRRNRGSREAADRQRVLDYATLDAAAALAETIESAQGSFAGLTANGNLSNTALQQAEVAAALSQGRINAGVAQVLAHQAAREASAAREAELARLEGLAAWSESRARANALAGTLRDAASRNRNALREGLLFRIPSFYGGN